MRDSPVRIAALLFFALFLAVPVALAQDNTTSNETNETTGTGTNETPTGEAPTNETTEEPTTPEPAGPITIELEGYQDGGATYFTLKGQTQRNPAISVQPGQQVTFVFTAVSGFHNLNVNNQGKTKVIGEGDTESFEWTAPADAGRVEYWCDPHKGAGMKGVIQIGAATGGGGGGGEQGTITGDTIDLGQYDPACAGKPAPAIVADGVVGAPTLDDYVQDCKAGGEAVTQTREKSSADLVIPISWGLIFVGLVGVVWVHKYYKP